jgi:hypothetical protein
MKPIQAHSKRARAERGATLLEMALLISLILVISVVGVRRFGRITASNTALSICLVDHVPYCQIENVHYPSCINWSSGVMADWCHYFFGNGTVIPNWHNGYGGCRTNANFSILCSTLGIR